MKYAREVLQEAVRDSISMRGVMRSLGIVKPSGGMHAHLRRRIDKFGIDTSHFRGRAHNAGVLARNRLSPCEVLVVHPPGTNRPSGTRLTRVLLELGESHVCAQCRVTSEWQDKPLTLHVDHINGEFLDCRRENLRFLCPNCHSQTSNFAGKSLRRETSGRNGKPPSKLLRDTASRPDRVESPKSDPERFAASKLEPDKVVHTIELVERGALKAYAAAIEIGCSLTTFYRLRERYLQTNSVRFGSVARPRLPLPLRILRDRLIVERALLDPDKGPMKIAQEVRGLCPTGWGVSEHTVFRVLKSHCLSTAPSRWDAFMSPIWDNDSVRSWAKPTFTALGSALAIAYDRRSKGSGIVPEDENAPGP